MEFGALYDDEPYSVTKVATTIPVSQSMIDDFMLSNPGPTLMDMFAEHVLYGRSRTNDNPMPTYVFFPRTQRVLDALVRFGHRCEDAAYAFRFGLPEGDDDW